MLTSWGGKEMVLAYTVVIWRLFGIACKLDTNREIEFQIITTISTSQYCLLNLYYDIFLVFFMNEILFYSTVLSWHTFGGRLDGVND